MGQHVHEIEAGEIRCGACQETTTNEIDDELQKRCATQSRRTVRVVGTHSFYCITGTVLCMRWNSKSP